MYDDIFMFVKLIDAGSFSALSRKLEIDQTTISRRMCNLEFRLGVTLFYRNTRRLEPNEIGRELYNKFQNQETSLQIKLDDIVSKDDDVSGILKVALPMTVSKSIISPFICDFLNAYPKVNLVISYLSSQIDLARDGFDIGISMFMPKSQNSVVKVLHKFNIQYYASKEYLKTHKPINTLDDLKHHKKMGFLAPEGVLVRNLVVINNKTKKETIIDIRPNLFVNNLLHSSEIAQSNDMLVAAWDSLVEEQVKAGDLVKVLPEYTFIELPCYLIKESADVPKLHKAFIQFIENCFKKL